MGILPLRFPSQHVSLEVAYLVYFKLKQLPVNHYAHMAKQVSKSLLHNRFQVPCWIADLNWVISHLLGGLALDTFEDM